MHIYVYTYIYIHTYICIYIDTRLYSVIMQIILHCILKCSPDVYVAVGRCLCTNAYKDTHINVYVIDIHAYQDKCILRGGYD